MRLWKSLVLAGLATLVFSGTAPAYCSNQYSCDDGYTDAESHPLRLVAYALHPVGYTLEWLFMRPIHALVSQPELCPIFGYSPETWGCDDGIRPPVSEIATVAPPPLAAPAPAVNPVDLEAARRAANEARQSAEEAKRAAEEAARAADKSMKAFEKGLQK
ncbi:MAG: hypothetical protein AB7P69_24045 [Candidatus Binatia bacterium]